MKRCVLALFLLALGCTDDIRIINIECDQVCYTGPKHTLNMGTCRAGIPVCEDDEIIGCEGEVLPSSEICDGEDNDCDGEVDEDVNPVDRSEYEECGPEQETGLCRRGYRWCKDGRRVCQDAVWPVPEICDGEDNNCNGWVDEGISGDLCYQGAEETLIYLPCHAGIELCIDGVLQCGNQVLPTPEVCDRIDNDCNGKVDDGLGDPVTVDLVFVLDTSSSMGDDIGLLRDVWKEINKLYGNDTRFRFAVVKAPGLTNVSEVYSDFVGSSVLLDLLDTFTPTSASSEPTYDALWWIATGDLPLSWRPDADRVILLATDEPGQSYLNPQVSEDEVAVLLRDEGYRFYLLNGKTYGDRVYDSFDRIVSETDGDIFDLWEPSGLYGKIEDILATCTLP